jgi:hypothetical protein
MIFEEGYTFKTETLAKNEKIPSQIEIKSAFETFSYLGKGGFGQVYQVKHVKTNDM